MKTNRHSLMAKGIMVLLSLLVLVFAFTYSWFRDEPTADAKGISAKAENSGDFEYAIGFKNSDTGYNYIMTDFTNSSQALNLEQLRQDPTDPNSQTYNLLKDYKPIDVTGDGVNLIRPKMSYGNSKINTESVNYSIADENVQYITFDLFFRSHVSDFPIMLGTGSYAVGASEIVSNTVSDVGKGALGTSSLAGSNGFNVSKYGDFSKDAIVGAIRVAFVPYLIDSNHVTASNYNTYTGSFVDPDVANTKIWIPRPDIHVNSTDGTTGWTLSSAAYPGTYVSGTAGQDGYINEGIHKYYNIFKGYQESDSRYHKIEEFPTANTILPATLNSDPQQFTAVSSSLHIGDYYYAKVNVRIWVEGTDNESRRALSGGRFAVNFKFTTN